jgi:hypothetical protein
MRTQLNVYLQHYVREDEGAKKLASLLNEWPILEQPMVVYRAHRTTPTINTSIGPPLYSSSLSLQAAIDEFAGTSCCIFKIHLPAGIRYIDVNKFLGNLHSKAQEKEIIFEKGGEFFTRMDALQKGFVEITKIQGRRVFETYYFPKNILTQDNNKKNGSKKNIIRNLNKNILINIFGDEYELYNNNLNMFLKNIKAQIKSSERISEDVEQQLREYFASI